MRSASARAAFTIDSACSRRSCAERMPCPAAAGAGSGGSWGKANPSRAGLNELLIVVLLRAADRERPRLLELADGGDDASLRHHPQARGGGEIGRAHV